jgi:hypothetical protein
MVPAHWHQEGFPRARDPSTVCATDGPGAEEARTGGRAAHGREAQVVVGRQRLREMP